MIKPVTITAQAALEIQNILENKGIPEGYALRVATKGMGCGVSFKLGFDRQKEGDLSYTENGITILVDKKEMLFLVGQKIDFHEGADGRGFFFEKE